MAAPNIKNSTTISSVYGKIDGYAVTTSSAAFLSNSAASGKVLRVVSLDCANVDGSNAADITITAFDGANTYHIAKTIAVPADATQVIITRENFKYLEEGWSLNAQASANNALELVFSYEEIS